MESAFYPNSIKITYDEKRYSYSLKEKIPLILSIKFVWHIHYTIFFEFVKRFLVFFLFLTIVL